MILEKIKETLEPLGIPVTPYIGDSKQPIYAVINELLEQPEMFADASEWLIGNYVQIDFIAKKNIESLVARASKLLKNAGFIRRERRSEYVPEAKVYRYMLRVFLITEYEEVNENEQCTT